MARPQIQNRPGPDCELTIRLKFRSLERFRSDFEKQIASKHFFLKTSRSKPIGTRVQLVFVVQVDASTESEIWSWGSIDEIRSPEQATQEGTSPGLRIKLMDLTNNRKKQIQAFLDYDEALEAVLQTHRPKPMKLQGETQTSLEDRVRALLELAKSDHYTILQVAKNASSEEIRTAYRKRSKEYHPDQYFRKLPEDLMEQLQKTFQKLTLAYRTLMDDKKRREYDISIKNYTNPEVAREFMPHVRKQKAFNQAYKKMVQGRGGRVQSLLDAANEDLAADRFAAAHSKLKVAQAMDPLNPTIKRLLQTAKRGMTPS